MTSVCKLRIAALAEASTLLLLVFVAVPLKHIMGIDQATHIMGPIHGATFVIFLWFVMQAWSEGVIEATNALRLLVGAMIPFGGIANERRLRRTLPGKAPDAL